DARAAHDPVAPAAVPGLEELLAGMAEVAGDEQLELHRPAPAVARVALGELHERASDPLSADVGARSQHAELRRVAGDVVDVDAACDPAVRPGDRDLPFADEPGELARRRARRTGAPDAALRDGIDVVDEVGQLIDQRGVRAVCRLEHGDGRVAGHATSIAFRIQRCNTLFSQKRSRCTINRWSFGSSGAWRP